MPGQSDVKDIGQGGDISSKRRFDARDWDYIADYVVEEYERRKKDRCDRERQWKEIDRQIAMEPEVAFKKLANGKIDTSKQWMAETEMPLQAQALEVLTADARRLMFPPTGTWFRAHAELTDEYLRRVDFKSFVLGDELEVPSKITQDNADKLVEGFLINIFRQTDFASRVDRVNAESFKYGMGVARGRMERKNVYIHEARGVRKEAQQIPVLVPRSIKNTYLDDPLPSMHSSQVLGDAHISEDYMRFENIQIAANRGSTDPDDQDGGWMPKNLGKVVPDKDGYVRVLEMEGDIVVPRKTVRSVVIPGAIVTVIVGGKNGGSSAQTVIRFRFRKYPFSSYLLAPYHYEGADDAYPTSPLMKGRPVQMLATDAANRLLDSAMLKNAPPVGYDKTDAYFAQTGGPEIYPYAQWGTTDPQSIRVHAEVGGDPNALAGMFARALQLYAELTGVLPARLGAQTVSHTTAFAKEAELQRGAVRTVDYVKQIGEGAMLRWLDMAYRMGRDAIGSNEAITFHIDAYGGSVQVRKGDLPERATFDWLGSGGPTDENQRMQNRVNALLLATKLDQVNMSMGQPPRINVNAAIDQLLREGGWSDIDAIVNAESAIAGAPQQGPAVAALQNLVAQQPQ